MQHRNSTWVLVLAAGEGKRLSSLTTDAKGTSIPKQYCSLRGGPSLLLEAMRRGHSVVSRNRICAIVADHHREWWEPALWSLHAGNVIVQPRNRGTANGILLSVLTILERDPFANIVFLPSDHHVADESVLAQELREAVSSVERGAELVLLGIQPDDPDPELGYIVPGAALGSAHYRIEKFIEKPNREEARRLISRGALWNSFIFAASGVALLNLFRASMPEWVEDMATALARDARGGRMAPAMNALYDRLPDVDFSRDIVERSAHRLGVRPVPHCGWSDLGTPARVADTLRRASPSAAEAPMRFSRAFVNLAESYAQLQLAS